MTEVCDVGIVGFGPAGATLAALLAKRGCRVSVFDKHRDIYPKPRAIGMDHEAMRIFQRVGLSDALDKNSIPYNPTVYLGTDGEPIQRIEITPPPNPLSWPPTSTFDQPALEEALRKHVADQDNVAIFLENEIVDCCEADGQVNLAARAKDGSTKHSAPNMSWRAMARRAQSVVAWAYRWRTSNSKRTGSLPMS